MNPSPPCFVLLLLLVVGSCRWAEADEVTLKNGGVIRGEIVRDDDDFVHVKTDAGVVKLPRRKVAEVIRFKRKKKKKKSKKNNNTGAAPDKETPEQAKLYATRRRLGRLLKAGSYAALDRELEARRTGMAPGSLSSKLVMDCGRMLEQDLARLDAWVQARPKSPYALFWRARVYESMGWRARGAGMANTVRPDAWPKFRSYLRKAQADLDAAMALDPMLMHLPAQQLEVTRCLSVPDQVLEKLFIRGLAVDLDYYWTYEYRLKSLMPKWGGTAKACLGFARASVRGRPKNDRLPYLLLLAHEECGARSGLGVAYYADPVVRRELDDSFKRLRAAFPRESRIVRTWASLVLKRGQGHERPKWMRLAAELGHEGATIAYARILHKGLYGASVDLEGAAKWYERAVELGLLRAFVPLGHLYAAGQGVQKDSKRAFGLYKRAAQSGDLDGMVHMALCYEKGTGVSKDVAKALAVLRDAEQSGSRTARDHYRRIRRVQGGKAKKN